jgi:hypothetical protein
MSTTIRRLSAVTVAAIIVVLTGVVIGLVSPQRTCRMTASPPLPTGASPLAGAGAERQAPPDTAGNAQQTAKQTTCSAGWFEVVPAVVGVAGGLTACAAMFLLLTAGRRGAPAPAGAGSAPAGPPVTRTDRTMARSDGHPARPAQAEADRSALIQACIYVRDRTTSPALAQRLAGALRDVGVHALEPAGARFDPAHHEAGGAAPSADPAKVGTIADVEVPGYADRDGRLLRVPVVTVYRPATPTDREDL